MEFVNEKLIEFNKYLSCGRKVAVIGLGREKEMTQREIGKMKGISRSYVSRIEKKALERLRVAFQKDIKSVWKKRFFTLKTRFITFELSM